MSTDRRYYSQVSRRAERRADLTNLTAGVLLGVTATLLAVWLAGVSVTQVPACQEDEVVVGLGDYSNGTWSAGYACVALDDLTGGE